MEEENNSSKYDKDRKILIRDFAILLFLDEISDQRPLDSDNFSSLELLLVHHLLIENTEQLDQAKKEVYSIVMDLKGGSNMAGKNNVDLD